MNERFKHIGYGALPLSKPGYNRTLYSKPGLLNLILNKDQRFFDFIENRFYCTELFTQWYRRGGGVKLDTGEWYHPLIDPGDMPYSWLNRLCLQLIAVGGGMVDWGQNLFLVPERDFKDLDVVNARLVAKGLEPLIPLITGERGSAFRFGAYVIDNNEVGFPYLHKIMKSLPGEEEFAKMYRRKFMFEVIRIAKVNEEIRDALRDMMRERIFFYDDIGEMATLLQRYVFQEENLFEAMDNEGRLHQAHTSTLAASVARMQKKVDDLRKKRVVNAIGSELESRWFEDYEADKGQSRRKIVCNRIMPADETYKFYYREQGEEFKYYVGQQFVQSVKFVNLASDAELEDNLSPSPPFYVHYYGPRAVELKYQYENAGTLLPPVSEGLRDENALTYPQDVVVISDDEPEDWVDDLAAIHRRMRDGGVSDAVMPWSAPSDVDDEVAYEEGVNLEVPVLGASRKRNRLAGVINHRRRARASNMCSLQKL